MAPGWVDGTRYQHKYLRPGACGIGLKRPSASLKQTPTLLGPLQTLLHCWARLAFLMANSISGDLRRRSRLCLTLPLCYQYNMSYYESRASIRTTP